MFQSYFKKLQKQKSAFVWGEHRNLGNGGPLQK